MTFGEQQQSLRTFRKLVRIKGKTNSDNETSRLEGKMNNNSEMTKDAGIEPVDVASVVQDSSEVKSKAKMNDDPEVVVPIVHQGGTGVEPTVVQVNENHVLGPEAQNEAPPPANEDGKHSSPIVPPPASGSGSTSASPEVVVPQQQEAPKTEPPKPQLQSTLVTKEKIGVASSPATTNSNAVVVPVPVAAPVFAPSVLVAPPPTIAATTPNGHPEKKEEENVEAVVPTLPPSIHLDFTEEPILIPSPTIGAEVVFPTLQPVAVLLTEPPFLSPTEPPVITKEIGSGIVVVTNNTKQTLAIDTATSNLVASKPYTPPQGWDSIAEVMLFGTCIFVPVVIFVMFRFLKRSVAQEIGFTGKLRRCWAVLEDILRSAFLNTIRLRHCRGEDLENLGSEGALYLALHRETAILILVMAVLGCSILLPLHLTAGNQSVKLEFTRSTVQHLAKHSPLLWVHTIFVLVFSWVYYRYISKCRQHVQWAWKHGIITARSVDMWDASVFVKSKLPEHITNEEAKKLLNLIYPGQISNVIVIMDSSEQDEVKRERILLEQDLRTLRRYASNKELVGGLDHGNDNETESDQWALVSEKEEELQRLRELEKSLKDRHAGKCIITFTSVDMAAGFADPVERGKAIRLAIENKLKFQQTSKYRAAYSNALSSSKVPQEEEPVQIDDDDDEEEEEEDEAHKRINVQVDEHGESSESDSDTTNDAEEYGNSSSNDDDDDDKQHQQQLEDVSSSCSETMEQRRGQLRKRNVMKNMDGDAMLTEQELLLKQTYEVAERAASVAVLKADLDRAKISQWEVVASPDPHDIIWTRLHLDPRMYWVRTIVANIVIVFVLLLLTTPTAILGLISHVSASDDADLRTYSLNVVEKVRVHHPQFASFLFVFLPQFVLVVVNNILSFMVYVIVKMWEPHYTYSSQELSMLRKNFWFLLFNTLFVPALAFKSLDGFVGGLVSKDANPFSLLGQVFVVTSGAFTLTYIITQTLVGSAFQLLSLADVFSKFWSNVRPWATAEERDRAKNSKGIFDFGNEYAQFISLLTLVMMFSTMVPIILPFGLAYFFVKICVDQYQLNYVCGREKSHGVPRCRIGRSAVRYLPLPLLLYQISVIGYFSSYVCITEIVSVAAGYKPIGCTVVDADDPTSAVPGTQVIRGTVLQLLILFSVFIYTASDSLYVFMVDEFNDQGMIVGAGFADQPFASDNEKRKKYRRQGSDMSEVDNRIMQNEKNLIVDYVRGLIRSLRKPFPSGMDEYGGHNDPELQLHRTQSFGEASSTDSSPPSSTHCGLSRQHDSKESVSLL